MTLQKLLLLLSNNKEISVECFCADGECTITLKEWFTFNTLLNKKISLSSDVLDWETINYFSKYIT